MATSGGKADRFVVVPPPRHILTSFEELIAEAQERVPEGEKEAVEEVAALLDTNALLDFSQLVRRRVKQNFRPFRDAAAGRHMRVQGSKQLEAMEEAFLDAFFALLQAAHFNVLTALEWNHACANDFTFTHPIDVNWAHMEPSLLQRFWARHPDAEPGRASVCDRVLVMTRGVHVARARGVFLQDKIDLLVLYLLAEPLQRLSKPLLDAISKGKASLLWPSVRIVQSVKGANVVESMVNKTEQVALQERGAVEDPALQHENTKRVERVTLKDLMPNAAAVLRLFFKEITIQEPTWRDVIILYRRNAQSQLHEARQTVLLKDAEPEELAWNLNIRRMHDVPNADIEGIFPDKTVYLKPLLLVQLAATVVIGLASVLVTVLTTEASWSLIFAVLSILGTRAFQVWSSAQLERQQVLDKLTERLYEQTMDAQDGVLHYLLDQTGEQHIKELLLAYFSLLRAGKPLTQNQLDRLCERRLKEVWGEAVDFALENGLPVLLDYGIVRRIDGGRLVAVPIEEARRVLLQLGRARNSEQKGERPKHVAQLTRLVSLERGDAADAAAPSQEQPVPPAAQPATGAVERPSRKALEKRQA